MRDIIIIGGGLTGMSAAWELERQGVAYTLIEVKARLGGSITTERRSGFILDSTAFVLEKYSAWGFLEELDLDDALVPIGTYRDGQLVIFRDGTQTLVDAVARRISSAAVMKRMAVSSIGRIDDKCYGVCLENGLMLSARGVIVTAPARYAEHMLHSLDPEIALSLLDYRYDPTVRVSLGYKRDQAREIVSSEGLKFIEVYDMPERVPTEHVLVRAGVRLEGAIKSPQAALNYVKRRIPSKPVMQWAAYWAEADPLTRFLPEHAALMDEIEARLPPQVVIAGSDYRARRLDQQVKHGRAAARKLVAALQR